MIATAGTDQMRKFMSPDPILHDDCDVTESKLGQYTEIGRGSRIAFVEMDDYSYCDRYADIANAKIGKFSNIASFARIGPTDHPLDRASLHHFMYRSSDFWEDASHDAAFFTHRRSRIAQVGHDTWIGHNAVIRPEVTVGTGAVVGAGAIVTKDVDPYQIVAGIPAKPMRARQPTEIADRLMDLAWWDWDHATLGERLQDFRALSAEEFLEKYE